MSARGKQKISIGLIGCGAIAMQGHLPALLAHPGFELHAVCDIDRKRALEAAKAAGGVEAVTDWKAVVSSPEIDAVILALHPEHGLPVASAALRAGKHVLDEKPFATDPASGRLLLAAVRRSKAAYQVGFCFREAELIVHCGKLLRRLGTPHLVRFEIFDELFDPANRNHLRMIQGILKRSSAITHEGSHFIDIYRSWNTAELLRSHASSQKTHRSFNGPNLWAAEASFGDGSLLQLNVGWLLNPLPPSRIFCVGPNGWFDVNPATGCGTLSLKGGRESLKLPPFTQNWKRQLDLFENACRGGKQKRPTAQEGYEALKITHAWEKNA